MDNLDPVLFAALGSMFALLAGLMTAFMALRAKGSQERVESRYLRQITDRLSQELQHALGEESADDEESGRKEVLETEIRLLSTRLDKLEGRFPNEATLEKYASVNDAILATRHEELARRMARLESEAMTPGKVILLLSTVLAVLFGMMAALPFILQQLAA